MRRYPFRIIDAEKFQRIEAATIVEWHAKGWLALVHFHLASLERFRDLLQRQSERERQAPDQGFASPAEPGDASTETPEHTIQ